MLSFIAQTTQPVMQVLDTVDLASVGGIILLTTLIMEVVKRVFGDKPFFKRIPIFVYVAVTALVLTLLSNLVFKSLQGELKALVFETLSAALASSGFYTWLRQGKDSLEKANETPNLVLFRKQKW